MTDTSSNHLAILQIKEDTPWQIYHLGQPIFRILDNFSMVSSHSCPSDWILYPSHGFRHLLWSHVNQQTSDIENFGSHLCWILPKHSPLGAVCYRFFMAYLLSVTISSWFRFIGRLFSAWDSITEPISPRLFAQEFSLFLAVRWRLPCRKVLPISVLCAWLSCLKPSVSFSLLWPTKSSTSSRTPQQSLSSLE